MTDKRTTNEDQKNNVPQPDPETLSATDPQENMNGPVSNMIQDTGEMFDSSDETRKEANEEREKGF